MKEIISILIFIILGLFGFTGYQRKKIKDQKNDIKDKSEFFPFL